MKKTFEKIVCDVCGKKASGEYWRTTYVNGEPYAEMYCPHDLCKDHMEKWKFLCEEQSYERYEGTPSDERRDEMLNEFIELLEVSE
ncbi:hypothetical protein DXP70_08145 [Listeria monocytogenes]|nr:hypothetical protein [Listeria monocytogenes]MDB03030.1 hypothetical protein [Listeria monocytogenes]MDB35374.1 hypothetical protein [Listeria monocytogenes]